MTVWHLRDLCCNKRRIVRCDDVKIIQVPYYDGLSIDDILTFARGYDNGDVMNALPEVEKELLKLPRSYIANIIYTIIGDPF